MDSYAIGPSSLVGEELNTVSFVMDYVEFVFNGPVLRALTRPVVEIGGTRHRFPAPGSRDALCELIGRTVLAVEEQEGDRLALELTGGAQLTVPLDDDSYLGPEAMHFCRPDAPMMVW